MNRLAPIALVLLCAACDKPAATKSVQPETPNAAPVATSAQTSVSLPTEQSELIRSIAATKADPKDEAAYNRFCTGFEKMTAFENWDATVSDSRVSTVNGAVDITFDIGGHVRFEQVVQKTDPVYPAIANLHGRNLVRISGTFPHRDGAAECGYYTGTFTIALTKVQ